MTKPPPVTVAAIVRAAIVSSYDRLVANGAEVLRASDDPEAVHQARVATRRLRSDLRTFEPWLDERRAAELRGELRWLGAEYGAVRDLDVMRDRLHDDTNHLPAAEAENARRVLRRLDADREAARADLLASLHQHRYEQLLASLARAATHPPCNASAGALAESALPLAVRERWHKLKHGVKKLGDSPPDEALHAVRVRAKRTRYAAEACAPAFGKPAKRFARAVARVQDVLGEHHDAVVAGAWLTKTAHECDPAEAYAIGMLAQVEHDAADAARAEFPGGVERGAPEVVAALDVNEAEVQAAGGVVTRRATDGALEVLVVHRPRYDDWSLPKGKLEPGESFEDAAVREVAEETGVVAELADELLTSHYVDRRDRSKVVRWWRMVPVGVEPWSPNHEVDETRWISASEAVTLLSYDDDRRLVAAVASTRPGGEQ